MSIRKSAGIVIGIILVLTSLPMMIHNSLTDRINPIVQETIICAEVPKSTQKYTMFKHLTKKRQAKGLKKLVNNGEFFYLNATYQNGVISDCFLVNSLYSVCIFFKFYHNRQHIK